MNTTMCTPNSSSALSPSNLDTVLHPLDHQVGGHTQLMLLDQTTVCKPLIQRELLFYLRIPHELRPFVPNYKGVVQVRQVDGCPIIYHPIRGSKISCSKSNCNSTSSTVTSTATTTTSKEKSRIKFDPSSYRDGSSSSGLRFSHSHPELRVQLSTCNDKRLLQKDLSSEIISTRSSNSSSNSSFSSSASSTSNCYSSAKDHGYSSRPSQRYFLLLENIASQFHLPCILDLKMGTRQHGDDASAEKRSRQMAKCAATTSASLGVRLGGMQVYREDLGVYLWKDKYFGRKLDEDGLRDALLDFFHNGHSLRTYAIAAVINRLKAMREAVEHQQFFRFYSTSLLIAYEGCTGRRNNHHHHPHHPSTREDASSSPSTTSVPPTISVSSGVSEHEEQIDDGVDDEVHDDDTGSLESFSIDDDDARFYSPVKQNNRSRRAASQQLLSSVTKKSRHTTHSHSSSGDDEDSSLENSLEFSSNSLNSSSGHHSRSFSGPFSSSSSSSSSSNAASQAAHALLVSGQMKYRRPDRRWQYHCSRSNCHRRSSPLIDVRMIDFAHTVLASPWNSSSSLPPPNQTSVSSLSNLNEEDSSCSSSLSSNRNESQDRQANQSAQQAPQQQQQQQQTAATPSGTINSTCNGASSSNKPHHDQVVHEGPDEGFLKGVNSLIRLLTEILESGRANGHDEMDDSDFEVEVNSNDKEV